MKTTVHFQMSDFCESACPHCVNRCIMHGGLQSVSSHREKSGISFNAMSSFQTACRRLQTILSFSLKRRSSDFLAVSLREIIRDVSDYEKKLIFRRFIVQSIISRTVSQSVYLTLLQLIPIARYDNETRGNTIPCNMNRRRSGAMEGRSAQHR